MSSAEGTRTQATVGSIYFKALDKPLTPFATRTMTLYVVEVTHEEFTELPFQEPPA